MSEEKKGVTISKKGLVAVILVVVLLVAGGVTLGLNWQNWFGGDPPASQTGGPGKQPELDEGAVDWQGEQPQSRPQTGDGQAGIAIPGYKSITLKADTKEQQVNFYNPEVNDCYFVMSLILPDGTKVWQSKMIAPGKGLYQITLDKTIPAGTYEDSILKYECYKQDDNLTQLNGGEVKLILEVA